MAFHFCACQEQFDMLSINIIIVLSYDSYGPAEGKSGQENRASVGGYERFKARTTTTTFFSILSYNINDASGNEQVGEQIKIINNQTYELIMIMMNQWTISIISSPSNFETLFFPMRLGYALSK